LIARHEYSDDEEEEETREQANADASPQISKQEEEWNHMQNELFDLHLNMLNNALERGYSYK
jgi:hypothetical protein